MPAAGDLASPATEEVFQVSGGPFPPLIDQESLWACDLCAQVCKTDKLRFYTCMQKLVGVLNLAFLFFSSTLFDCLKKNQVLAYTVRNIVKRIFSSVKILLISP